VEYYSAIKENAIMLFAGKLMELENIMLSKVSQAEKIKGYIFFLRCESWTCKINVHINDLIYTYMILYTQTHINIHIKRERDNIIILVGLS
jgi:hypothetical protein